LDELEKLKRDVENARINYLNSVKNMSSEQASFKPAEDIWSASEITEHLFHAEFGGILGMWEALDGLMNDNPPWKEEHYNRGLSIEEVVEKTWKSKEKVPEGAKPRLGGPISFWINALESCQNMLENLAINLSGQVLDNIVYPHPISGPLDVRQRFEFLRFHIDRHRNQVESLKQLPDFPKSLQ
jgi:hypothetical protein